MARPKKLAAAKPLEHQLSDLRLELVKYETAFEQIDPQQLDYVPRHVKLRVLMALEKMDQFLTSKIKGSTNGND